MTLSDSHQRPPPDHDVEATTLTPNGSPPITRNTFPTCRAPYPGGSSGCSCRSLPHSRGLPQMAGGSASALSLSRPAQASLTLRPAGSLSRQKRPLSRGFSPAGCPTKPLVSYRIYRHLSGWILPPRVIRAVGAHCQTADLSILDCSYIRRIVEWRRYAVRTIPARSGATALEGRGDKVSQPNDGRLADAPRPESVRSGLSARRRHRLPI